MTEAEALLEIAEAIRNFSLTLGTLGWVFLIFKNMGSN